METKPLWKQYTVKWEFGTPFAAALPKTMKEIEAMLEHRVPSEAAYREMANPVPLDDLAEQVAEEVGDPEAGSPEERGLRGWATFPRDDGGIFYEARCVRAHLKDCALQVSRILGIRNLKALVANRVYVEPEKLHLIRPDGTQVKNVDGTEVRMIHVLTRQGPRNDIKRVDYVAPPCRMGFTLRVLNDGAVTREILAAIMEYGGTHGIGQERSQQWGQYRVVVLEEV